MIFNNNLEQELKQFWKWAGISIHEYDIDEIKNSLEEFMYPRWNELVKFACDAIEDLEKGDYSQLNFILEVMALDNEEETVLIECENKLSKPSLDILIKTGFNFPLSTTRWQIAELIGRKRVNPWKEYLLDLINDKDKYVQRRALLSLVKIDPKSASEISLKKLDDKDEMIRLIAIRILNETSSACLEDALMKLENDTSLLVLEEVESIKKEKF
jgi:hypothetical protein